MGQETVGQTIRRLRESKGIAQEELAQALGVRALSVGRWGRDEQNPQAAHRLALAQYFGVDPQEVGYEVPSAAQPPAWALQQFEQLQAALRDVSEQLADLRAQLRRTRD